MPYESTFFRCEIDGPVAHLIMDRPEKANSMTPDFWDDLPRLVRELGEDPKIRALVISGAGKHFSSGMDIASFDNIAKLFEAEPARAAHALRKLILQGASVADIRAQAVEEGMLTLRMDGIKKIERGITTLEEVVKETAE